MRRRDLVAAGAAVPAMLAGRQITAQPSGAPGDIGILRSAYLALHPGLLRYNGPRQIAQGFDRLERDWATLDQRGRFLALARFTAGIRCGHSYPNFYNQSRAVVDSLFGGKTRLPFAFRWIEGRMVITADHGSGAALAPGTVIRRINGVTAGEMLKRLMPLVRADGGNDAKRRALLSVLGRERIETFDVFHGLVFGAPADGMHLIEFEVPGKPAGRAAVPAIDMKQRLTHMNRSTRAEAPTQPSWKWEMRTDGIAILTMDSWAMYNAKWDWKGWLDERLDSLSGARGLIVDLRANEGGNDCGDLILSRIGGKDIIRPRVRRLVRAHAVPAWLNPYLDTWDDSFRDWGDRAVRVDERFFELDRPETPGVIAARPRPIAAPVIVLTGPQNSSATFQFAQLCQASGRATLLGEATGGNRRGINGGAYFFVRLPQSGLECDLPLIGYFPEQPQPDAGIEPDIHVPVRAADIAAGADRQMEAAIARLQSTLP